MHKKLFLCLAVIFVIVSPAGADKFGAYLPLEQLAHRLRKSSLTDAQALDYCRTHQNAYVFNVFPFFIYKLQAIEKTLKQYGTVITSKHVSFNKNGALNFIRLCYAHEGWTGSASNNFRGARKNMEKRFSSSHDTMHVFLIECADLQTAKNCKSAIRALFYGDVYAVHANDSHEQAVALAQVLFNSGNINYLNSISPKNFHPQAVRTRLLADEQLLVGDDLN